MHTLWDGAKATCSTGDSHSLKAARSTHPAAGLSASAASQHPPTVSSVEKQREAAWVEARLLDPGGFAAGNTDARMEDAYSETGAGGQARRRATKHDDTLHLQGWVALKLNQADDSCSGPNVTSFEVG